MNAGCEALAEGESLLQKRELAPACRAFKEAERRGAAPDLLDGHLWQVHMLAGDFELAWQRSDALRRRNAPDPHRFWTGEPIDGKRVVVRCLHGFGDAVQMLRYAPQLRERAAHVTYELPPRLHALGTHFDAVEHVITWGGDAPATPPAYDLQVEIMELPYLFRTTLAELPITANYLKMGTLLRQPAARPRIGVAWSTGSWNAARSIPFKLLETLFAAKRFEFINLQGQGSSGEAEHLELPAPSDGIVPLAETIAQLDLVLTVDTLVAHLAGALSIPCWLLLQHAADWRWLDARTDSPWYPSLTLFRQPTPGNWAALVAQMQQRLATLKA